MAKIRHLWYHLKSVLKWVILLPVWIAIRNKHLIKKYPFLELKSMGFEYFDMNRDKLPFISRYATTWNDILETGWRKAFGKQLWDDILKAIKEEGNDPHDFAIEQCKEKWGTLRLYMYPTTDGVDEVIDYYEDMSMLFCLHCGKYTKYITRGYVSYICPDCLEKINKDGRVSYRGLTLNDVPHASKYDEETDSWIDVPSKVPFKKYWPAMNELPEK